MSDDCLFCRIVRGEIPGEIVYDDEDVLAFNDINPAAPSHVLVIPKRHIECVDEITQGDDELIGKLVRVGTEIAKKLGIAGGAKEKGFRLVMNAGPDAEYSVFHIHLHLIGGRKLTWPPG